MNSLDNGPADRDRREDGLKARLHRRDVAAGAIAFGLGSLALAGCGAVGGRLGLIVPSAGAGGATLKPGQRAPNFSVTTVDGTPISGGELLAQKRPYVLFFFATW